MRIALISSSFAPAVGGVEEAVHQLARGLRANGHAVEIDLRHLERRADPAERGDLPAPTLECVLKRESPDGGGLFCRLPPRLAGAYSRRQLLANAAIAASRVAA